MAQHLTKPRRGMSRRAISCRAIALIAPLTLASPAIADPTIGFGLSITFGGGLVNTDNNQINTAIGLRIFTNDEPDTIVGAIGLDYVFGTQSWRGTVGAAHLGDDAYISLDLGINLQTGARDFGIGIGGVNTSTPTTTAPATAPVTPPPTPTPPPTVTPPTPTPPPLSVPVLPPSSPVT